MYIHVYRYTFYIVYMYKCILYIRLGSTVLYGWVSWAALVVELCLQYRFKSPPKTAHYSWLPWGLCCVVLLRLSQVSSVTRTMCSRYTCRCIIYMYTQKMCMYIYTMYLWSNILYTDSLRWKGWWLSCLPCSNWKGFNSTPSLTGNVSLNTATICARTCIHVRVKTLRCTQVHVLQTFYCVWVIFWLHYRPHSGISNKHNYTNMY